MLHPVTVLQVVFSSSAEFSSCCSCPAAAFGFASTSGKEPTLGIYFTEKTPLFLIVGGKMRWEHVHLRVNWAALGIKVLIGFVVQLADCCVGATDVQCSG